MTKHRIFKIVLLAIVLTTFSGCALRTDSGLFFPLGGFIGWIQDQVEMNKKKSGEKQEENKMECQGTYTAQELDLNNTKH